MSCLTYIMSLYCTYTNYKKKPVDMLLLKRPHIV